MSALGQKRTLALQQVMSALPPKAASRCPKSIRSIWSRERRCILGPCLWLGRLFPRDVSAALTAGRRCVDLHMPVVGIAPAPTFKQTMRGRDLTQLGARRQFAARIDHPAPQLADVECLATRVLAGSRTTAGPDPAHEQHAYAVIVFQIVDVGLEPRCITNTYAYAYACLG